MMEQPQGPEFGRQFRRQIVPRLGPARQVGRRVPGLAVAPAHVRAARLQFGAHQLGAEDEGATLAFDRLTWAG